jgi:hypothetical protein
VEAGCGEECPNGLSDKVLKFRRGFLHLLKNRRSPVDDRDEIFEVVACKIVSLAAPTKGFHLGAEEVW